MKKVFSLPLLLLSLLIAILVVIVTLGYLYRWDWVGVVDSKTTSLKTLWDWMDLLIVPLALAIGVWWLNWTENKNKQARALEESRESTLHNYLDQITELVLTANLNDSRIRELARARTLAALRVLDGKRKGFLLSFLSESILITPEINKQEFALIDLQDANFKGVQLQDGYLVGANLDMADFSNANLRGAFLVGASLGATNLEGADLTGAIVSYEELAIAASLERAVMPSR